MLLTVISLRRLNGQSAWHCARRREAAAFRIRAEILRPAQRATNVSISRTASFVVRPPRLFAKTFVAAKTERVVPQMVLVDAVQTRSLVATSAATKINRTARTASVARKAR